MPVMPEGPALTRAKQAARAAREQRLAEALRANLRRRKEQVRGRATDRTEPESEAGDRPVEPDGSLS